MKLNILIIILLSLKMFVYSDKGQFFIKFKPNMKLIMSSKDKDLIEPELNEAVSVNFNLNNKSLHFIGVKHTNNFESKVFELIENEYKIFKPDAVIAELNNSDLGLSPETIKEEYNNNINRIHGENDYLVYLAVNKYPETKFILAEPSTGIILKDFVKYEINGRRLNEYDLLNFYLIRSIKYDKRDKRILNQTELISNFDNIVSRKIKQYDFNDLTVSYDSFVIWYKNMMNRDFDLNDNLEFSPYMDDKISFIDSYLSNIRDCHILKIISNILNKFDNVLIVYGYSHYFRLRNSLRDMFETEPEEIYY